MAGDDYIFVGRQKELDEFQALLDSDSSDSHLILIDGIGGIGKSELSRQCIVLAAKAKVNTLSLDWNLNTPNTVEAILTMLASMVSKLGRKANSTYLRTQKQQIEINTRIVEYRDGHPEVWQKLLDELSNVRDTIPGITGKLAVTGIELLADLGPRATAEARNALLDRMAREKQLKNSQELALARNPANQLAQALVQDIAKYANNKRHQLVIWLDTNEVLSAELEQFLRESVICPILHNTKNVIIILAGRPSQHRERAVDADSARQMGYSELLSPTQLTHWSLDELIYDDVQAYMKPYTSDPDIIMFVMEKSRGVPVAMDLIRTMLDWDSIDNVQEALDDLTTSGKLDDFIYRVTDRFLRYVQRHHPEDESDLFALALLLEPNDGALQQMWELTDTRETRQRRQMLAARYSFVNRDGSLQDVVHEFLLMHMMGEVKSTAVELSAKAGTYFKPLWEREHALHRPLEEKVQDNRWQQHTRDYLNVLYWYNETNAVRLLVWAFIEALLFNHSFARYLLQQILPFQQRTGWFSTKSLTWIDALTVILSGSDTHIFDALSALREDASHPALRLTDKQQAVLLMSLANIRLRQSQAESALDYAKLAEGYLGDDPSLVSRLASTYQDIGSALGFPKGTGIYHPAAMEAYTHGVALNQNDPWLFNGLGVMLNQQKEYEQALLAYNSALALDNQQAVIFNNRGNLYADLKRYEEALADYAQAIKLNPEYASAFNNRGSLYADLKRYEEALADYAQAIQLNPEDATAFINRGTTHLKLARYEEALTDYECAIKLNPDDGSPYYNTACAYALQSLLKSACEWLSKAIALDEKYCDMARTDPDFDAIRDDPCFQALINPE